TYFSVSLVFWYIGLIPDLATIRDRATSKVSRLMYGTFAMGWDGSAKTWARYEYISLILAGLSTPLVLSVHTIESTRGVERPARTKLMYSYRAHVFAGLSTPLVLSVHTIVSMDFATSVIPGWHTTIFPPYFVAGAIFSGFAMVQNLMLI